jgi:hypothetical protein
MVLALLRRNYKHFVKARGSILEATVIPKGGNNFDQPIDCGIMGTSKWSI